MNTIHLDLQIVDHRTPSGFAAAALSALDPDHAPVTGLNELLTALADALHAVKGPLVISIDSVDHGKGAIQAIDRMLSEAPASTIVVTADQVIRTYLARRVTVIPVLVGNFSIQEIYRLISTMRDAGQLTASEVGRLLTIELHQSLGGVPVLVRLALEAEDMALIEFGQLTAGMRHTLPLQVLLSLQRRHPVAGKVWEVLRLVSAPMSLGFLSELLGQPALTVQRGLDIGIRLGAIRDCGNGQFRLHDEVARRLRPGIVESSNWLRQRAEELGGDPHSWSDLERLFLATLADDTDAVTDLLNRVQTSLRAGQDVDARVLVESSGVLADAIDKLRCSESLRAGAKIAMAYVFTREHDSSGAVSSLGSVREIAERLPDMHPRWLLARAHATLSPARIPGQTVQDAADDAESAALHFGNLGDVNQFIAARVTYARALNLLGRHGDALDVLQEAVDLTRNANDAVTLGLRADTLDELGDLYRMTERVSDSELMLLESDAIRKALSPGWTVGSAYRSVDLGQSDPRSGRFRSSGTRI